MSKKQKRNQLINYFLTISQKQQEIQNLQNELVSHLRFNPVIIFKKISAGNNSFTFGQLKLYIKKHLTLNDSQLVKKYFFKHFRNVNVKLEQFTESILPYTPNVLREVSEKINEQMETRHYDKLIEETYHRLLQTELKSIFQICVLQREIGLDWNELKKFIRGELNEYGKKIDTNVVEPCSIVNIRKWMQLWIRVDQFKILNIMRWFGGYEEKHLQRIYENNLGNVKCTCSNHSNSNRSHSLILSFQSRNHSREASLRKNQSSVKKITKVKSQSRFLRDSNYYLKLFMRYVETIIKSQRRLTILREGLRSYRRETEIVLHEIASKKTSSTRLGKIIQQMYSVLQMKQDVFESLMSQLKNTKIDNNFIFSLYAGPPKKGKNQQFISKNQILKQIFQVLYTFCLSKATLKSISRDLYAGISIVFKDLDENSHDFLDKTDLKLILQQSSIKCKQNDLIILMNHFGDGEKITEQSLKKVIQIQKSS